MSTNLELQYAYVLLDSQAIIVELQVRSKGIMNFYNNKVEYKYLYGVLSKLNGNVFR